MNHVHLVVKARWAADGAKAQWVPTVLGRGDPEGGRTALTLTPSVGWRGGRAGDAAFGVPPMLAAYVHIGDMQRKFRGTVGKQSRGTGGFRV
jgi:hypothetical protein